MSPMRQRSNSDDYAERESPRGRESTKSRLSSSQRMSTNKFGDDENETPSTPPVLAGSYRKGTVNAMATSRAQDAMIRHQVSSIKIHMILNHLLGKNEEKT